MSYDSWDDSGRSNAGSGMGSALRAAAIFSIPIIVADFFNYYSAGTSLIVSGPILLLLYLGCGALAAYFAAGTGQGGVFAGTVAGFMLWGTSTLINVAVALLAGFFSFGGTLLLGVPYLCICGPFHLIAAGTAGALGAGLFTLFGGDMGRHDGDSEWGA